ERLFSGLGCRFERIMSDALPSSLLGIRQYLDSDLDSDDDEDTCSVHLRLKNVPKPRKHLVSKKQSSKFMRDIERVRAFQEPFLNIAWTALRTYWIANGEIKLIEAF